MTAIAVDASVAVDLLLGSRRASVQVRQALVDRQPIVAPDLLDVEVSSVIRRYVLSGSMDSETGSAMVADLIALPFRRFPTGPLIERAFEFRDNMTVYDGVYLALAERLGIPLLTADAALAKVPGSHATVQVVV